MNFKNLSILTLLAALSFSFASCSDDDDKKETAENYYFLPTEVKTSKSSIVYEYDAQHRLVKYINNYENDVTTITYATDGKPSKVIFEYTDEGEKEIETSLITYNGNTVTIKNADETDTDTETYTINDKGQLLQITNNYNSQVITFEYDNTDRLVKEVEAGYYATYTYDSKNGLFKDVNVPQWLLYLIDCDGEFKRVINNLLVETDYDSYNEVAVKETYNYTYNDAGFPTKFTYKYEDKEHPEDNEENSANVTYKTIKK